MCVGFSGSVTNVCVFSLVRVGMWGNSPLWLHSCAVLCQGGGWFAEPWWTWKETGGGKTTSQRGGGLKDGNIWQICSGHGRQLHHPVKNTPQSKMGNEDLKPSGVLSSCNPKPIQHFTIPLLGYKMCDLVNLRNRRGGHCCQKCLAAGWNHSGLRCRALQ